MTRAARYLDPVAAQAPAAGAPPRPALFLDRDGVVNVNHGYVHAQDQVEWIEGIFELAREARDAGLSLVVATNQAGIARGYYDEATFLAFTGWMHERFRDAGAPLLATYYCPHHPTAGIDDLRRACSCRKPAPGMLLAAADDLGLDLGASCLVGDAGSDLEAAAAAGVGRAYLFGGGRLPPLDTLLAGSGRPRTL